MQMSDIPFGTTDWSQLAPTEHKGERGCARWRTRQFGAVRVRMVEYTPGYFADHWCTKGHIILCTEGELHTELKDGRKFTLKPGMSYQVADNAEPQPLFYRAWGKTFHRRLSCMPPSLNLVVSPAALVRRRALGAG